MRERSRRMLDGGMIGTTVLRCCVAFLAAIGCLVGNAGVCGADDDPVFVWEVCTTVRGHLRDAGRMRLLPSGKTESGIDWSYDGRLMKFGTAGRADARFSGAYFFGKWNSGWGMDVRVLINNTTLKTATAAPVGIPDTAGQSWAGTKPNGALKDNMVDYWEFSAIKPRSNQFIRLTTAINEKNQVVDGNDGIATFEFEKNAVVMKFVDPKFGRVVLTERKPNVLSGRTKPVNRQFWNIQFERVQRRSVFRTNENDEYVLYTNNRVNSPVYTPDYYSTWNWYFYPDKGKRVFSFHGGAPKLTPDGRGWTNGKEKALLVAGLPLQ